MPANIAGLFAFIRIVTLAVICNFIVLSGKAENGKIPFYAPPANDNFANAIDLSTSINATCSSSGQYTTSGATADKSKASCWSGGPYNNVWFKFTATSSNFINIKISVSLGSETMRYPMVGLWDASLSTQLQCQNQQGYGNGTLGLSMSYYGLTPGATYYIAVDNYVPWGPAGSFDICLNDVPDYDYPQGATDISAKINAGCTNSGTYSNQYATADGAKGSCWSGGPYNNRWFKFVATSTSFINIQVKVSGTGETMRYPMVALWDASLSSQLQCQNQQGYGNGSSNLSMSYSGLTPGATYYIEVDNYVPWGPTGSFDLCLSDVPDYDYPQGAVNITSLINGCSATGMYSNVTATADGTKGSCWSGGPYYNRWFKFVATSTSFMNIQVKVSGAGETMRYPMVSLWDASLTTQLQCQNQQGYGNGSSNLSMSYSGLTPGATYYVQVDNYLPWGPTGTFDLCLSDVPDYDYPKGAIDLTASMNRCSAIGVYSNVTATADGSKGSCWSGGPYYNRWFKFVATSTSFVNLQVKVSRPGETMRYAMVALWDSSLTTQLQCQNQQGYGNGASDLSVSYDGLTPGKTYFIEVDNYLPWGGTGSFGLCISDRPDYDYPKGAVDLTSSMNGCSVNGLYSNTTATADGTKGSCWSGGPYYNRWFKFVATSTNFINIQVKVSGAGETMRYPMVALWDASMTTQLQCQNQQGYGKGNADLSMSYKGLTPGATYYIEVDNYLPWGPTGTFDICISDQPDYDYPLGAVVLTNVNNYCTSGGTYSNITATPDQNKGSCWSGGPYNNRWFKFQAVNSKVTFSVNVNGAGETMRYPMVALWESNYVTQLACQNQAGYGNGANTVSITYNSLVVGNWYYISVDNYIPWGSTGTFDICINNSNTTQYYSIGSGNWNNPANWSTVSFSGPVDGTIPSLGSTVNIQDKVITVSSAQECTQVNMTVSAAATQLVIDNATLTVHGLFNQTNTAAGYDITTTLQNSGKLNVLDNAVFTSSNGSNNLQLNINSGSNMSVGQDMTWNSSSPANQTIQMTLSGSASLNVGRDLSLNGANTAGVLHNYNNNSAVAVGRDIIFSANAAGLAKILVNNSASLSLKQNLVRASGLYGVLFCDSDAKLTFNGNTSSQNLLGSSGADGDNFYYSNVTINNTSGYSNAVLVNGAAVINGNLNLLSGKVQTNSTNLVILSPSASTSPGSSASSSYISGPLRVQKNTSGNSVLNFPIGKGSDSRPIVLNVNHSNNNLYSYTAELMNASATDLGYTLPSTVNRVSSVHYWMVNRVDNNEVAQPSNDLTGNQTIQVYFGDNDIVTDGLGLTVVKNTAASPTTWFDIGGAGAPNAAGGANLVGSVTSTSTPTAFTSFSTFTLGNKLSGLNPLPIKLLSFTAAPDGKQVKLNWRVDESTTNNSFIVERSNDGIHFEKMMFVNNSGSPQYFLADDNPYYGTSYYRLKTVNDDQSYEYSRPVKVVFKQSSDYTMKIFPNPVSAGSTFYLSVSGMQESKMVTVNAFDIQGKILFTQDYLLDQGNNRTMEIRLKTVPPSGIMLLVVRDKSSFKILHQQKIVIQ
jgi:hypothetical protein